MATLIQTNDSQNNTSAQLTLREVNDIYASLMTTGVVFSCLFIVLGVFGNGHVIYIYASKFPPSNHRLYLLCLAALDMTTCTVAMPFTVVDLTFPLMTDKLVAICKIRKFLNYFIGCAVGMIMLLIAYDRYHKICRPLRLQISYKQAKILCVVAILIACLFSWPALVLFGGRNFHTKYGIVGVVCFSIESNKHYMLVFHLALLMPLAVGGATGIVFYFKIGQKIFNVTKPKTQTTTISTTTKAREEQSQTVEEKIESPIDTRNTCTAVSEDESSFCTVQDLAANIPKRSKWTELRETLKPKKSDGSKQRTTSVRRRNTFNAYSSKTKSVTVMFLIITILYVASYVPFLLLTSVLYERHELFDKLTFTSFSLYYTFLWCFFINNILNPIIYALCDFRYRNHLRQMYSSCLPSQRN